jgi:hypothetical protein
VLVIVIVHPEPTIAPGLGHDFDRPAFAEKSFARPLGPRPYTATAVRALQASLDSSPHESEARAIDMNPEATEQ